MFCSREFSWWGRWESNPLEINTLVGFTVRCQFQYDFFPERYGSPKGSRNPLLCVKNRYPDRWTIGPSEN